MQVVLLLILAAGADASRHSHLLSKCVRRCESENACHSSLESFTCEATCKSMCECAEKSRHMLNKPRHCQPAMIEEQKKQLALIKGKSHMSKVKLAEEEKQPDQFDGYIALEDFWPKASSAPNAKPRMLNGAHSMSLLNQKKAEPWSAAVRPSVHRHASMAQILSKPANATSAKASNATKAVNASNASKVVVVAKKDAAPAAKKEEEKKPAPAKASPAKKEVKTAPAKNSSKAAPAKK